MNLKRLYAIDGAAMLLMGAALMGLSWWGGHEAGPVTQDGFWRTAVFIRTFGATLAAFGLGALAVWRMEEPQAHRAAVPFYFVAHAVLLGIAWAQKTPIWGTPAGVILVNVLALLEGAFGYTWLFGMRQPGFPYTQTLADGRAEWESRIREAAEQQERNRLARELHDSIKQQIYAIQTLLAAAEAQPERREEPIELARESARNAMAEMNALLDQLRASPLETVGLVEALRRQCEALGHRAGAEVRAAIGTLPTERRLSPASRKEIFRIAQEALSNVARHARASHVTLEMGSEPPRDLVLSIRDDGQGFAAGTTQAGMGLRNMQARAASMGARLDVQSAPGAGCTVTLRVPLQMGEVEMYCRHMRIAGGAFAFACGLLGMAAARRQIEYALPGLLVLATAVYHLGQYLRWKRMAKGAQA